MQIWSLFPICSLNNLPTNTAVSWDSVHFSTLQGSFKSTGWYNAFDYYFKYMEGGGSSVLAECVFHHLLWAREMPIGDVQKKVQIRDDWK